MIITFENDNNVIVYALEKVISYARDNQYIFLAQSVWRISSIIGLQQELITLIDHLRRRNNQNSDSRTELDKADKIPRLPNCQEEPCSRVVWCVPSDLQKDSRNRLDFQDIHLDRISQVDNKESTDYLDKVLKETEEFLEKSQLERKRFDPLRRTKQGKVQPQKLAKKERKRLNRII
jgi:hypothetical protein